MPQPILSDYLAEIARNRTMAKPFKWTKTGKPWPPDQKIRVNISSVRH